MSKKYSGQIFQFQKILKFYRKTMSASAFKSGSECRYILNRNCYKLRSGSPPCIRGYSENLPNTLH